MVELGGNSETKFRAEHHVPSPDIPSSQLLSVHPWSSLLSLGCSQACGRQLPHIPLIPLLGGPGIVRAEGPSQMASFWGPQSSPTYFELLPLVPSVSGAPPADQSAAPAFLEASGRTLDAAAKTETVGLDPHLGS